MPSVRIALISNTNPPYVINTRVENFVYCPDPSQMADEAIEREMPRARWLSEMTDLTSLAQQSTSEKQTTSIIRQV